MSTPKGNALTFPQIKIHIHMHTDGQLAHDKMINITNHQGNENQNHNEISPHTCGNGYYQK